MASFTAKQYGPMRDHLRRVTKSLEEAAKLERSQDGIDEIEGLCERARDLTRDVGHAKDADVAQGMRDLDRVVREHRPRRGTTEHWRKTKEISAQMEDFAKDLPL